MENSSLIYLNQDQDYWLKDLIGPVLACAEPHRAWARLLADSVHVNNLVDLGKNWRIDPEKLADRNPSSKLVVNMSADPFARHEESIAAQLAQLTDNFVILSTDAEYFYKPTENICFFPFWYLHQRRTQPLGHKTNTAKNHVVSCLNKVSRYHRIENYVKLKKRDYFNKLLFTMWFEYDKNGIRRDTPRQFYQSSIIAEFESLIPDNIKHFDEDWVGVEDLAYIDAYVHLVTETSIKLETIFCSEKTWKPFRAGQFVLFLSNPGTVKFLRHMGLDLFDDIFEHHQYDAEPILSKRIDMIHTLIDRVMTWDIHRLFCDTTDRRQANIDRFYSQDLEDLLTSQCSNYVSAVDNQHE